MIKEDYVSFEVAKLLKEKGFDESTSMVYMSYGDLCKLNRYYSIRNSNYNDITKNCFEYTAPTIQMTMKWLREVCDIYVDISICVITKNTVKYNINVYYKKHKNDSMYMGIHLTKECSKYEQACETGIKYSLENLI